jgi:hypothetical protein
MTYIGIIQGRQNCVQHNICSSVSRISSYRGGYVDSSWLESRTSLDIISLLSCLKQRRFTSCRRYKTSIDRMKMQDEFTGRETKRVWSSIIHQFHTSLHLTPSNLIWFFSEFIWLREASDDGLLGTQLRIFVFNKRRDISWAAEEPSAWQWHGLGG